MGIILGSTMAGPVKVCVPIENALGDSAPPQGRFSRFGPAFCHDIDCRFVSLKILIFSNYLNEDCIRISVGISI